MVILLKTVSVRVSSIQIMQVRVQNKGKSVWKSRYDGDVSITITETWSTAIVLTFSFEKVVIPRPLHQNDAYGHIINKQKVQQSLHVSKR